jgi:hypothetical protein
VEAHAVIERAIEPGAIYEPEQLKIRAWMMIEPNHVGTGLGIIHARTKLAQAILSVAKQRDAGTPVAMAKKAIRIM